MTQKHPEQFRPLWVTHPEGFTTVNGTPAPKVRILVVEVVRGDVDAARRELDGRYHGNLCVVGRPGLPSLADQASLEATVGKAGGRLMNDRANGIYTYALVDTVQVDMTVLTPELYDKFAAIGSSALVLKPWLRRIP